MDVTPVSMDEGEEPVVCIEYEQAASEILSYLYAMNDRGESSDRALELSRRAILCNLSGYTAWAFRRMILEGMGVNTLDKEFSEGVLDSMPKNYQLWNHRRRIAESTAESLSDDYDLGFAERAIEDDAKNYHAWAHRQALLEEKDVSVLEKDREYVERLIDLDVHNNSAWTQRAFVFEKTSVCKDVSAENLFEEREFPYVTEKIKLAPHNKASWSYLYGLMTNEKLCSAFWRKSSEIFGLVFDVLKEWPSSPPAMDFLGQAYVRLAGLHAERESWKNARKAGSNAVVTWEKLQVVDPIRSGYYHYMMQQMNDQMGAWPE